MKWCQINNCYQINDSIWTLSFTFNVNSLACVHHYQELLSSNIPCRNRVTVGVWKWSISAKLLEFVWEKIADWLWIICLCILNKASFCMWYRIIIIFSAAYLHRFGTLTLCSVQPTVKQIRKFVNSFLPKSIINNVKFRAENLLRTKLIGWFNHLMRFELFRMRAW